MRVIQRPYQKTELESDCQECSTRVALLPEDCDVVFDQRDGVAVKWQCPTCNRFNWVATSVMPPEFVIRCRPRPGECPV
jgi:hypothetical protein